jgi:cardiolipin synthase
LRAIPHLITLFRLFSSLFLAWLLVKTRFEAALGLVLAAGLSDWLDGFAARRLNIAGGHLGIILDPLADKVLLVTLFCTLAALGLIPLWMFWLAIGRDVVIVVGAWLVRVFRGIRTFLPTMLGKVSTFFQIVLVLMALLYAAFPWQPFLWLKDTALVLSALFTGVSGLDYVRKGIEMARRPGQFAASA